MTTNCLICDMDTADEAAVVFRDELWAAEVVPGYDVPGWFFLRSRRHADRITGLDVDELATFGQHAKDLVSAVTAATGSEATYMLMFGEAYRHFHVLITARGAELPPERRGGDILKLRPEAIDPVAARALVPAVRQAYVDITTAAVR